MNQELKNKKTVLLVMDVQNVLMSYLPEPPVLLNKIRSALEAARIAKIQVIYITLSFREGYPEIDGRHQLFSSIKSSKILFTTDHEGTGIHEIVAPQKGDIIVNKKRTSAFTGSDLEVILRSQKVESIVLTGFASSGVVLSTLRQAADMDYDLTVLSDACGDPEPEIHEFLVSKIFPFSAKLATTIEWVDSLWQ